MTVNKPGVLGEVKRGVRQLLTAVTDLEKRTDLTPDAVAQAILAVMTHVGLSKEILQALDEPPETEDTL